MKKRSFFIMLFISVFVCILSACSNEPGGLSNDEYTDDIKVADINDDNIVELSDGCFNEYGYYNFTGSLIYYFDSETKKRIVLCDNPNCTHSSSECNAYISSKADKNDEPSFAVNNSAVFIFSKDDKLYFLLTDGTILTMKYDGTEHRNVTEIDSKYIFEKAYMIENEIIIYSFYSVYEQGELVEKACFIHYNIDTNEWNQGEAFDRNLTGDNLVGITDNNIAVFYHDDEIPEIPRGTSISDATRITRSTKCQIYSINIYTSEKAIIFDGTIGDCAPVTMLNGVIYFHSQNTAQLCTINSQTKEITVVCENISGEVLFDDALDNCLVIARTKVIEENWNPENEVIEFFNVATKELTEAYKLESNLDWNNNFRGILAETKDSYIMIYKAFFVVDDADTDIPSVSDMTPYVGIISKTDFWNQQYNFEKISWNF